MDRRSFLKHSAIGSVGTLLLPSFLQALDRVELYKGFRRLVVIQLSGGNDGLNTVIPFEDDIYHRLRPQIRVPKGKVLAMNDYLGLHPEMGSLHKLYKEGYLSVINSVGYPNPNRSHFRSMDIWHTGVSSDEYSKTGWLGRYLDAYCEQPHAGLELDSKLSLSLNGEKMNGLALEKSDRLYNTLRGPYFKELINQAEQVDLTEDNQGYLYKTLIQTNQSAKYLAETHEVKSNNLDFPQSKLGKKLGQVSQFIRSGFDTQVYYVSHNGFDTHARQENTQSRLLKDYSESVYALVRSLEKSGDLGQTLILTFSEFGRRVQENGSKGTDHGKANCLFLIGENLKKPGLYNEAPNLASLDEGDLKYSIDFRNIYHDIIREWFNKDPSGIVSGEFDSLGVI